ncbi:hypothetical protein PILCRDRAFT_817204 [Piloderma croceum F 1598]|uniref:methylated diphthine methylhydrolase n=1 Tax=Piloderma croceum (strain F 1598) TaxID=765440 RepID=A0A0C3G3P5_PILCF|nr:hypothetical protein PILCRDRAFT_817204 [Piloderma croceum F 1598]
MKWCHRKISTAPLLGIADSEGNVSLYKWIDEEKQLDFSQSVSCAPPEILCLSLDWSNRRSPTNYLGSLIVSLSDGNLCLLQPKGQAGLLITDTWVAHDHEPWVAAWNYWDTNIIYSGGDDLKMKAWDVRQGFYKPMFVNKHFDAGITTIQSHPNVEHLVAVGSYDNSVRLFDVRKPFAPLIQADVGGGAWRVKWHPLPARKNDLLVACMHDGFKILRFNVDGLLGYREKSSDLSSDWDIIKRYDAHDSLAYGVDWSFAADHGTSNMETLIASGSFYDHALHLWRG